MGAMVLLMQRTNIGLVLFSVRTDGNQA